MIARVNFISAERNAYYATLDDHEVDTLPELQ